MGHWNHRVIQRDYDGETFHEIVEAYYDDEGNMNGYTQDAIAPVSEEGVEGLRWVLQRMLEALDKPVIVEKPDGNNKDK
jgi:hypothetical protein